MLLSTAWSSRGWNLLNKLTKLTMITLARRLWPTINRDNPKVSAQGRLPLEVA